MSSGAEDHPCGWRKPHPSHAEGERWLAADRRGGGGVDHPRLGGVGPTTTTMLIPNMVQACEARRIAEPA